MMPGLDSEPYSLITCFDLWDIPDYSIHMMLLATKASLLCWSQGMPSTAAAVNDDTHWALSQFNLTSVMDMRFRPRKPATETLLVAFSSFREHR